VSQTTRRTQAEKSFQNLAPVAQLVI